LAVLISRRNICCWAATRGQGAGEPLSALARRGGVDSQQIEGHTAPREKVSTSVDLPLSHECKRVLAYGAEEAERLNHKHIGTEHLLLGLLREEKCFAAEILHERGLRLTTIREELQRSQSEKAPTRPKESSLLSNSAATSRRPPWTIRSIR